MTRNPPFPAAARPVRDRIRKLVPRPPVLPEFSIYALMWFDSEAWPEIPFDECCPQGLLPGATEGTPATELDPAETAFADWWDYCTQAQAAVNTVWGKP